LSFSVEILYAGACVGVDTFANCIFLLFCLPMLMVGWGTVNVSHGYVGLAPSASLEVPPRSRPVMTSAPTPTPLPGRTYPKCWHPLPEVEKDIRFALSARPPWLTVYKRVHGSSAALGLFSLLRLTRAEVCYWLQRLAVFPIEIIFCCRIGRWEVLTFGK